MRLLDTDTCVEILRGNQRVFERRAAIRDEVATTWITAAELHYGAAKSKAPERNGALTRTFLDSLPILGLGFASVRIFGEAKALLEREEKRLADADLLIGAIAIAHRATIVTGNRRHYERIPGILVENWIRE